MAQFWFLVRLRWMVYVLLFSLAWGAGLSLVIIGITLTQIGFEGFTAAQWEALLVVAVFWFRIAWVLGFLIALMMSFKTLFNHPFDGHRLVLLDCESQELDPIILSDVLPIWRKFLFWMIWILVIVASVLLGLLNLDRTLIGGLTLFVLILLFGAWMLKPILGAFRNVRIR